MEYLIGILASISAQGIWVGVTRFLSFVPSKYPDLRGTWKGVYKENDNIVYEKIYVTHQFGKKLTGYFVFSDRKQKIEYRYKFKAKFMYSDSFQISFFPEHNEITDFGIGLYKVSNCGSNVTGASISFNFTTGKVEPRYYQLKKYYK